MTEQMRDDEEHARARLADPVVAQDLARLKQLRPELAAFARAGYHRSGRGFVLLPGAALAVGIPVAIPDSLASYIGERGTNGNATTWATPGIAGMIAAYDPQHEMLIVISRADGLRIYRITLLTATP